MEKNWWDEFPTVNTPSAPAEENWWGEFPTANVEPTPTEPVIEDDLSPPPPEDGLTREQIVSDAGMMSDLRNWMVLRKGQQFADRTDDEVYDAFEEHMRTVESGELTLVGEIQKVSRMSEEEKALGTRVYELWDSKASAWSEGWGEFGEAAWDRVSSAINPLESPTVVIGLGFGKLATGIGAKTVGTAAIKLALRNGGRVAAKRLIRDQAIKQVAKGAAVSAAFDASMSGLADVGQQRVRQELDLQDEWHPGQTALAAGIGGVVSGGIGALALRGGAKATAKQKVAQRLAKVHKAKVANVVSPQLQQAVSGAATAISKSDWALARQAGDALDMPQSIRQQVVDLFFDTSNPNSVSSILISNGVKIDFEEGKVANNILGYIDSLPTHLGDPIKQPLAAALGTTWDDAKDKLVSALAESGKELWQVMKVKQQLTDKMIQAAKMKNPLTAKDMGPEWGSYLQTVWKRLLISHPATSAVNVQGWMAANATRTSSEVLQSLFTLPINPVKGVRMGKAIWDKAHMYANLMGTKEQWDDVVARLAPSWARNAISRETFGGVANKNAAELHRIPDSMGVRATEKTVDMMARMTFVNAQDEWTRALSAMMELDRQVRIHTGKSYDQLVRDGEEHLLETAEWAGEAWGRSLETALKDTFSYDYSIGAAYGFNRIASAIQGISNAPGLGLIFPFGKFVANAIAYTARYSPLGLIDFARYLWRGESYEGVKALSDATVGMTAIAMLGQYSYEKMKEGFQWNQAEQGTGDIIDIGNLAPISQLTLLGRMYELAQNGQPIPSELISEFGKQVGVGVLAEVSTSEFVKLIKSTLNYLSASSTEEADASGHVAWTSLAKMMGSIAAGVSRPVDPINDAFGMSQYNNIAIDRRMAMSPQETFLLELTRYTDQLLAPILGEGEPPTMSEPASSITRPEGDIVDPNPAAAMTGLKRSQPMSWVDKALGMVNLPAWKQETRSTIPEFDNFIFREMAPKLDEAMKRLLASDYFKKASLETKRTLVKKTISQTKESILDDLEKGMLGENPDLYNERRKFMTNDVVERREALQALELENFNPRELTYEQLLELNEFMEMYREDNKDFIDMMK